MNRMIARWLWPLSVFSIVGVIGLAMPVTHSAAQEQVIGPGVLRRRAKRVSSKPSTDVAQKTPQHGEQDAAKKEHDQEQIKHNERTLLQLVEELRALPIGKEKGFYQQTLKERGYTIANTQETQNRTEFTLEKGAQTLRFIVQFDETTGTSIKVHASGARLVG